jgi:hypothetical protein
MKTLTTFLILLTIFSGCSSQSAFDKFHFSKTRELSEDSIISQKLLNQNRVEGIVTTIYLNKVLPDRYNDKEYFYIYMYDKEKATQVDFLLNGKKAASIEELPAQNQFTYLTSFEANWSQYYLVSFEKDGSNKLKLEVVTDKGAKAAFVFVKDK